MKRIRTYKHELDLKAYPYELSTNTLTDYSMKVNTKE